MSTSRPVGLVAARRRQHSRDVSVVQTRTLSHTFAKRALESPDGGGKWIETLERWLDRSGGRKGGGFKVVLPAVMNCGVVC